MHNIPPKKNIFNFLSFQHLSLKKRLPLLIFILLLIVIVSFSLATYLTIWKSTEKIGKERLRSLTGELATMLSQSTGNMVSLHKKTAKNDSLREYATLGNAGLESTVLNLLKKLRTDSSVILVELIDNKGKKLLGYSEASPGLQAQLHQKWSSLLHPKKTDSGQVLNMFSLAGTIYYPIITPVSRNSGSGPNLVSWRQMVTAPGSVEQINNLMGRGASLAIGNKDGSLWTDLNRPIQGPAVAITDAEEYFTYKASSGNLVIAATQPISNSSWRVLIEYSKEAMLESANRFLKWLILIGGILLLAGIITTWQMSSNITGPLNQITDAAIAISKGDYTIPVNTKRNDELGKLAHAFEEMKQQVQFTQAKLENKVKERTAQLEAVNKELEAFSYSVSHDLRAPLRGIIGFTSILEDKYTNQLDDEAKRLTNIIKRNTIKMGSLIDDLLSFSKFSRQDLLKINFSTSDIITEIITDMDSATKKVEWDIQALPHTFGDINSIRQVWVNLISNALKYSGNSATPRIEIGSYSEGGQIVFFIKDNGVGFDTKYMDKLFKVFQRLHSTKEFEGTGVGLAIVEKIISRHGGKVWAKAEKDNGATFFFSLPSQ